MLVSGGEYSLRTGKLRGGKLSFGVFHTVVLRGALRDGLRLHVVVGLPASPLAPIEDIFRPVCLEMSAVKEVGWSGDRPATK